MKIISVIADSVVLNVEFDWAECNIVKWQHWGKAEWAWCCKTPSRDISALEYSYPNLRRYLLNVCGAAVASSWKIQLCFPDELCMWSLSWRVWLEQLVFSLPFNQQVSMLFIWNYSNCRFLSRWCSGASCFLKHEYVRPLQS